MAEGKMRLLIAEDEEAIRRSIRNFIKNNTGCVDEIFEAGNGQEALDCIYRYHPHIMFLDIQMPVKDGLTVMKEASEAGVCPRTIILSGHSEFEYVRQALRLGAVDYLLKPCRSTEILGKLEAIARNDFPTANTPENSAAVEEAQGNRAVGHTNRAVAVTNRLVNAALDYMNDHYPENLTLPLVAGVTGVTASYLSTLFSRTLGSGFVDCLNRIRVERSCDYFIDNRLKNYEVAYRVGFHGEKYFSNVFKKLKGVSPSEYRNTLKSGDNAKS
jgi:two-component system response regulator YesN